MTDRVLVTGVSGFLGSQVALSLLKHGYQVRGSLRDVGRGEDLRSSWIEAGVDPSTVEFCQLDLRKDDGWKAAAQGCRFVIHTASPFVLTMPRNEEELTRPAVEGTRRALRAAIDAGAERIVLTSSVAAIDSGHRVYDKPFGPADWTDINGPKVSAYMKSKTRAEREAWSIVDSAGLRNKLAVINPATILGPLTTTDPGTSAVVIQRMLRGDMPMLPNLILSYVDVRDVAEAHVLALTSEVARGARTILANPATPLIEISKMLRGSLGNAASKVPTRQMPNWFASLFGLFDGSLRAASTYLGTYRCYDSTGARALLGRDLRSTREAVEATATTLISRGLV